jgi:hypothetical protein
MEQKAVWCPMLRLGLCSNTPRIYLQVKSSKLLSGPSIPGASKKRTIQDIFGDDNDAPSQEDSVPPKKKKTSKFQGKGYFGFVQFLGWG